MIATEHAAVPPPKIHIEPDAANIRVHPMGLPKDKVHFKNNFESDESLAHTLGERAIHKTLDEVLKESGKKSDSENRKNSEGR
jgi:hypothetical protein